MKFIRGLSSVALLSCLSVHSGAAVAKVTEEVSNSTSLSQAEPVLMANIFRRIQETVETMQQVEQAVEQVEQAVDLVNSVVQQENRRQELEAAREAATERERLEAERRQQYFESLSPEERQAYIEEQRAMQAQRETEANLFLLMLGAMVFGGSDAGQQDDDRVCRNERQFGINDFETMTASEARGAGLVCN